MKAKGKNQKDLEEAMKTGEISGVEEQDFSVDPYEPHPDFRFTKGQVTVDRIQPTIPPLSLFPLISIH